MERRNPDSASAPNDREAARLDEADLTFRPDEAGIESSDSDSLEDTASERSLPAGPAPVRRRTEPRAPTTLPGASHHVQSVQRRCRGKQSGPHMSRTPVPATPTAAPTTPAQQPAAEGPGQAQPTTAPPPPQPTTPETMEHAATPLPEESRSEPAAPRAPSATLPQTVPADV